MTTKYLKQENGQIAYDDQGSGPLVICVPSMGDMRGEYRFLDPSTRLGWISGSEHGCARDGGIPAPSGMISRSLGLGRIFLRLFESWMQALL